jgi:hypothetical protein
VTTTQATPHQAGQFIEVGSRSIEEISNQEDLSHLAERVTDQASVVMSTEAGSQT